MTTRDPGWRPWLLLLAFLLGAVPPARAQQALLDLTLEELMQMQSGRVFGASERMQPVTEAPASVSFVTSDEITRYGYHTLADVLRGVRGLYVTDDRNFSLLGARGFATPGDYNSRILLLVNGHRVNDNVFGQAEIGAEFGLDAAMFERVEIIRGPASSLYGDSAFFAVVNVITKTGASVNGAAISVDVGTLGSRTGRASVGHRFLNGTDIVASGTVEASDGEGQLYFPAFDTPATNHGIAEGLDGERVGEWYTRLSVRNLAVTAAYGSRRKDVPTASFSTLFNEQNDPERTTDRHVLVDAEYGHQLGEGRVSVRGSFDRFTYDGIYPFAGETVEAPPLIDHNSVAGARWTAGARLTQPLPGRQLLIVGAEFIDNFEQKQHAEYIDPPSLLLDIDRSSTQRAVYAQNELKLSRWLILNGGLRYDRYETFSRVTPRAAVIVLPSSNRSFKYLYGRAFRAPNEYELNAVYFGEQVASLTPESIDTHELVWERYTHDWLRTSVSAYWYNADRLITPRAEPSAALGTTFVNEGQVRAAGLELEAQMRLRGGMESVISYAFQRASREETHERLKNSPAQIAKIRFSAPGPVKGSSASLEVLVIGSRQTLAGNTLKTATTANVTVVSPLKRSFEFVATVRNLLDQAYSDPASDQHLQDDIPQNGRTIRVGVRWNFTLK